MYEAIFFYSDLSSDFMLVPHMSINLTGEKNQHNAQRSERSIRMFTTDFTNFTTNMAALKRDGERLDPSTRVLAVLARISERGCQTFFIRSITTKIEMTCISWGENKNKTYFSSLYLHRFVILFVDEVFILISKDWLGRWVQSFPFDKCGFLNIFF